MASNEIQLSEELNEQAGTADLSAETSAYTTSPDSSLISVANPSADSFCCYMSSDDSIFVEYSEKSCRRSVGKGVGCNYSNSTSVPCNAADVSAGVGTFFSRHLASPTTTIQHSTPISTPVKSLISFGASFEELNSESSFTVQPSDTNSALLQSNSTSLIVLSDSTLDCSNDSLILVEPDPFFHTKKRKSDSEVRKSLVTHEECCICHCLSHFTAAEVNSTLQYFKNKSNVEQNQFLLDSFRVISNEESTNHILCGKLVCKIAYIKILQISEKRYRKFQTIFKRNPSIKIQSKPVTRSLSPKVIEAKTWMTRYFNRIGDSMPHMDQVHLPHGLTKQDIYYVMKSQLQEQGVSTIVSLSHYYSIWNSSFRKVVIPKI